jgi:hypothetical protein
MQFIRPFGLIYHKFHGRDFDVGRIVKMNVSRCILFNRTEPYKLTFRYYEPTNMIINNQHSLWIPLNSKDFQLYHSYYKCEDDVNKQVEKVETKQALIDKYLAKIMRDKFTREGLEYPID